MSERFVFPITDSDQPHPGLTKRELFAAMAMQGCLSNEGDMRNVARSTKDLQEMSAKIAGACIVLADALIAELAK